MCKKTMQHTWCIVRHREGGTKATPGPSASSDRLRWPGMGPTLCEEVSSTGSTRRPCIPYRHTYLPPGRLHLGGRRPLTRDAGQEEKNEILPKLQEPQRKILVCTARKWLFCVDELAYDEGLPASISRYKYQRIIEHAVECENLPRTRTYCQCPL